MPEGLWRFPWRYGIRGVGEVSGWRKAAACRGVPVDVFFDRYPAVRDVALLICSDCPVREECLEEAKRTHEHYGVRGGKVMK